MPTIVISYRRDDSKWITGRIFDRLEDYYGKGNVFMDIDTIPVGLDFREHLQQALDQCDILLAVVGPRWLGTDEHGRHATSDERDWVRLEIETALAKNIPVIPVLIDRQRMPKASELPESLRAFAFRQAAEVDTGLDFRFHMDRLMRSMDKYLERRSATSSLSPPAVVTEEKPADAISAAPAAAPRQTTVPLPASPAPSLSLKRILTAVRSAAQSWFVVAACLLVSQLLAFVSEGIVRATYHLALVLLLALPLGVIGLIAAALHILAWLELRSAKTGTRLVMLGVGILLIAAVPTFFFAVRPPEQYATAAAWPLILLGGLGLTVVAIAVISHPIDARGRNRYLAICLGSAILLLTLAWLESDLSAPNLWITDWRVRSVVIFTCVFVGSTVFISTLLFWLLGKRRRASS
jgi:TIR domain